VNEAVDLLKNKGGQAAGMVVNVSRAEEAQALAEFALQSFGRLEIWVNNAGIAGPYGPTLGFESEVFKQVVDTNILGVYYGSMAAMRHFTAQGSGKLINILGHGYNRPVPWQNAYGASKAWVRSFTLGLAEETRGTGVGVFAFNPGMVLTDLLTDVDVIAGSENRLKVFPTIVRMWAKPPEVPAAKALWIASSATDGKTGLLVSIFNPWTMLSGALKEGWRRLLRKKPAGGGVKIRTVPHAK
jgi:glucose 1-dehydrogenase